LLFVSDLEISFMKTIQIFFFGNLEQ